MESKFVIFVIMGTLLVAAIYSSSMLVVFAKPPFNGYVETCTNKNYKNGGLKSTTCCYQYYVDGKENTLSAHCNKTCYDQNGEVQNCPKRTAEEEMVDPGLLGEGTLKGESQNDTNPKDLDSLNNDDNGPQLNPGE
jgi:hypothetical protein